MTTTNVNVCWEPDDGLYHVELSVELDLYYEPSDPSVGLNGDAWCADGWEDFTEFRIWYNTEPDNAQVDWEDWSWEAKTPRDAELAAAFFYMAHPEAYEKLEDFIDEACDRAAGDYEPDDDYEPPCEEYDKYKHLDREVEW